MLAHRQRIVTPEDRLELQPFADAESGAVILFDGRLDDRAGLAEALGITPSSGEVPDSQLALFAHRKWGSAAGSHLIGDYALAVYSPRNNDLCLCVSPQGHRILYYHRRSDLVLFATSIPALTGLPGLSPELDEIALVDFLAANHADTERTLFRDITRVCPGTAVTLSAGGGAERLITWTPRTDRPLKLRDQREYVEAASDMLDRVIASQLRCEREVAILGSGGFDSGLMAASATRLRTGGPVRMVTMRPEARDDIPGRRGKYSDENPHVTALASALPRLRPEFVRPFPASDIETEPGKVFSVTGLPLRVVTHLGWIESAFQHLAKTNTTAILDGTGGNQTLTWDGGRALADLFSRGEST